MSSSINYTRNRVRSGFTLVELLIVITIIGLLVGLLAVVGGGVISGAREFSVNAEIIQMNQATENFNTKYGFYPPSFEQFKRTVNTGDDAPIGIVKAEALQILPFLNMVSPNHQELSPSPARSGYTRLDDWWEFVGCNLDQSTSLQFWLSGLFQNKQFPLTGGLTPADNGDPSDNDLYLAVAYNVNSFVLPGRNLPAGFDREVFFDFETERLAPVDTLIGSSAILRPTSQYVMEFGKTNGDLFYVYRDSDSYQPVAQPNPLDPVDEANNRMSSMAPAIPASAFPSPAAYVASPNHRGPAYYSIDSTGAPAFANPNTFQIISFGLDGDPGVTPTAIADGTRGLMFDLRSRGEIFQDLNSDDNLCNFAGGRLEKFIDDSQ